MGRFVAALLAMTATPRALMARLTPYGRRMGQEP